MKLNLIKTYHVATTKLKYCRKVRRIHIVIITITF